MPLGGKASPEVEVPDMRPLLWDSVYARCREGTATVGDRRPPARQLSHAGLNQRFSGADRVRPVRRRRPARQPADLGGTAKMIRHAIIVGVPKQMRRRDDARSLRGDQRYSLANPSIDEEFARLALQLAQQSTDRHRDIGHNCCRMRVDQRGHVIPVSSRERAYENTHRWTSELARTREMGHPLPVRYGN